MPGPTLPRLPIDTTRMRSDFERLAAMTEPDLPYTRLAFTPLDLEARRWTMREMEKLGLMVRVDPAANIIGRRRGRQPDAPALMTGSHLDTVRSGGRFDGIAGVVAALEVVRALNDAGLTTRHPLDLVVFTCEEASVLGLTPFGSRAMAGTLDPKQVGQAVSPLGTPLPEALAFLGGDLSRLSEARLRPEAVKGQVELHIEQGPEMEERGVPVGAVTVIAAPNRGRITVHGSADHAGATSMERRRDALTGASEIALALEAIARHIPGTVGTVGQLQVFPNQPAVVPGAVQMSVEIRAAEQGAIDAAKRELRAAVEATGKRRGLQAELLWLAEESPIAIPEDMRRLVEESSRELGIPCMPIISRASHDSARIARTVPVCMVFVPSHNGRSHCPEEWTEYDQVAVGAQVLGRTLLKLDQE